MKIIKNYIYNFSYQIFLMIVPVVTMPYIARVLGPEGLGINSYTYSISYYFVLISVVGLATYGQREVAYVRDDAVKLNKIFWEIELLSIITTIFSFSMYVMYIYSFGQYETYLWAYSIAIIANIFDISWLLIGLEKFGVLSLRNLLIKISMLILIFSLVKSKDDLLLYIVINTAGMLVSNLTLWPYIKRIGFPKNLKSLRVLRHLKYALVFFVPQLSISIYTVLNKVMLGIMSSIDQVAYFDSSDKIIRISFSVLISLSTVLMPVAAHAVVSGNKNDLNKILKYSISFSMMIAFPMMFGIMAIANNLVPLFLGSQYTSVIPIMILQSLMIMPMAVANVIGNQFLVPTNQIKIFNTTIILGSIANLLINMPMIYYFGALGAAISVTISEMVVAISQMVELNKKIKIFELFNEWYKYFFSGIIMFAIICMIQVFMVGWFGILLDVIVGFVVYFCILYVFKPSFYLFMLRKVFKL